MNTHCTDWHGLCVALYILAVLSCPGFFALVPTAHAEPNSDAASCPPSSRPDGRAENSVWRPQDYGAQPDGTLVCTKAIQEAIDACAREGGGTVRLEGGHFLSGTLFLKDGVTLEIAEDAVLLGSVNLDDYPVTIPRYRSYTDNYTERSLIYGENVRDVSLSGSGIIDGQGAAFPGEWKQRPYLIRFIECHNVRVHGLSLRNSAMWMQHYLACDGVTLQRLRVHNHCNRNNDMVDIDGCSDVLIEECIGDTDDDGITLKSTSARPCERVTIRNCTVSSHCNAIKCGTESNGGFRNISISHCTIKPSAITKPISGEAGGLAGVALEIVDGGVMENVTVSDIRIQGTLSPLFVRLGDRARPFLKDGPRPGVGELRNVVLQNITAMDAGAMGCPIVGLPGHPIRGLTIDNVAISSAGGGTHEDVQRAFDEKAGEYPECRMFAPRLPAFGLFCWHVEGLTLTNVTLQSKMPDARPAVVLEDVRNVIINGKTVSDPGDAPEGVLIADK